MRRLLMVRLLAFLAVMSLSPLMVSASTWRVEQDGSGDFLDIQPAVDAAAAGDTIRIGPGRFDTFHPFTAPGWTEEVIVRVTKNNLTFIGSGKDITIIGTSSPYGDPSESPKQQPSWGQGEPISGGIDGGGIVIHKVPVQVESKTWSRIKSIYR